MKKRVKRQEGFATFDDYFHGLFKEKIIKSVPLKKHFIKKYEQLIKQEKRLNLALKKSLEKLKNQFWKQIQKDVKAKSTQLLRLNLQDSTVEFLSE